MSSNPGSAPVARTASLTERRAAAVPRGGASATSLFIDRAENALIRGDRKLGSRRIEDEASAPLRGKQLQRALSGSTWLYNTVYGEPCTLELRADRVLVGRAGYANDDCDTGRWWIEDDRWHRQWTHWAYGEVNAYTITLEGDQVRLFNGEGLLVDTSLVVRTERRKRGANGGA